MKNANTVTLTQDALTAIIAQAVAQALNTQAAVVPTQEKAAKVPTKKAAKRDTQAQAKRAEHKARVATWNAFDGLSIDQCIAQAAKCILANRKTGTTNENIDATDVRHFLSTREHQSLRRATWKNDAVVAAFRKSNPDVSLFNYVRDGLVAATSEKAATRKARKA